MRKDVGVGLIVAVMVVGIITTFIYVVMPNLSQSTSTLRLGDGVFRTRVASNNNTRAKGLSGVTKLGSDEALLMAYPTEDKWGIWMKDMNIPIDIVWLNSDKKVIHIVKNASPEYSTLKTYVPKDQALYVVELPAGTVESKIITTDSTADFQINEADIK